MGKTTSLADAVLADLAMGRGRYTTWDQLVAPEHKAELESLASLIVAGKIAGPQKTVARFISKHLRQRGISDIGIDGVTRWVQKLRA